MNSNAEEKTGAGGITASFTENPSNLHASKSTSLLFSQVKLELFRGNYCNFGKPVNLIA